MNNELRDLYNKHINGNEGQFVYGGVFNEEEYLLQEVKLLFILKEAIDESKNETWSLVDLINKQIEEQKFLSIWKRIGELSFGFYNEFPPYHTCVTAMFHYPNITEGLEKIAVINLKKTGGRNQSEMSEIKEHAIKNKDLLLSEIEIIRPNLIICGGTFDIVCEIFEIKDTISKSGARIGRLENILLIDFVHPGYYMLSPKIMYAYFKEVMNQLK